MVKLRGIAWDHPRARQPLEASIAPYKEETGVEVEWEARSLKDFGDAPIDDLAQKYDLLIYDHPHCGLAEETGCLIPLDAYIDPEMLQTLADESAGPSHSSYLFKGHQWGLAIDTAMQSASYRKDLLDGKPPARWEDVVELGRSLEGTGHYVAIPLVPTDAICSFLSLCAAFGDPPGKSTSGDLLKDDTSGLWALDMLIQLKSISHPQSINWNPIWMYNHMSQNDDVVYCPLAFTYTNYSRNGYAPKLIHYSNIPGVKGSILGGAGFGVSAKCEHPDEAVAYGVWLCSAKIQSGLYVEEGGQPGNRVAWESDNANKLTHDFFRASYDTLKQSYVRPRYDGWHVFQEKAGDLIHAMLRDGTPDKDCLNALKLLYEQSLESL